MSRGQRHRQCGCFSASWDLHARCSKHSVAGDCLYFSPGFADSELRCVVCALWTSVQWLKFVNSQAANSARKLSRARKLLASAAEAARACSVSQSSTTRSPTRSPVMSECKPNSNSTVQYSGSESHSTDNIAMFHFSLNGFCSNVCDFIASRSSLIFASRRDRQRVTYSRSRTCSEFFAVFLVIRSRTSSHFVLLLFFIGWIVCFCFQCCD
jgi:hypothetical protein